MPLLVTFCKASSDSRRQPRHDMDMTEKVRCRIRAGNTVLSRPRSRAQLLPVCLWLHRRSPRPHEARASGPCAANSRIAVLSSRATCAQDPPRPAPAHTRRATQGLPMRGRRGPALARALSPGSDAFVRDGGGGRRWPPRPRPRELPAASGARCSPAAMAPEALEAGGRGGDERRWRTLARCGRDGRGARGGSVPFSSHDVPPSGSRWRFERLMRRALWAVGRARRRPARNGASIEHRASQAVRFETKQAQGSHGPGSLRP